MKRPETALCKQNVQHVHGVLAEEEGQNQIGGDGGHNAGQPADGPEAAAEDGGFAVDGRQENRQQQADDHDHGQQQSKRFDLLHRCNFLSNFATLGDVGIMIVNPVGSHTQYFNIYTSFLRSDFQNSGPFRPFSPPNRKSRRFGASEPAGSFKSCSGPPAGPGQRWNPG